MVSDASGGGDASLASLNLVSPLCWSLTTIFTVTAIGAGAVVARRTGEGSALRVSQALWTSLGLALVLGLMVTGLCVAFRDVGIAWLGEEMFEQDPQSRAQILGEASGYLTWFLLLFPLRAVVVTLESTVRGLGNHSSRSPEEFSPIWSISLAMQSFFTVSGASRKWESKGLGWRPVWPRWWK